MPSVRTLLVLGRASNLPTVWSNCLAAWILAEGGNWTRFLALTVGATLLYLGGMYLNDAFDEDFDRQHRRERPIPNGQIKAALVWQIGFGLLSAGFLCVAWLGSLTAVLAVLLVAAILLYDWLHKMVALSPVLMALCRVFLFLMAASATEWGLNGISVWSGLALGCYIVGLSYVAKKESLPGVLQFWPLLFLAAPLLLGWLVNDYNHRLSGIGLMLVLVIWVATRLRYLFRAADRNVGYCVSGLLAGIVLTDLLAVGLSWQSALVFGLLFLAALLFQRFIPAT
jgi:hypothetical protein